MEHEITIQAKVDHSTLTIGDQIHYTVTVTHRPEVKLLTPLELKTADFKILKKMDLPLQQKKGFVIEGKTYVLTTFDTGPRILAAVRLEYLDAQGNKQILESNEVPVTVQSVLSGADYRTDIRDVKGVAGIAPHYQKYLPMIGGVLGTIILLVLFLMIKKKLKKHFSEVDYLLTPYEEAVKRLGRLAQSLPSNSQKVKPFYLELSHVIRHYLERNFGISTEELTTHEISEELKRLTLTKEAREKLLDFFESCDLVKFSKFLPELDEIWKDVERGKTVVELSRPPATEPTPSTA